MFRVIASGQEGEARIEAIDAFVVGPSPEEVAQVVPTTRYLGVLAESTGGRVESLAAPDLKAVGLRSEVVARVGLQADEPLWNHPAVFLLLLLALALEWYAERKIGYT